MIKTSNRNIYKFALKRIWLLSSRFCSGDQYDYDLIVIGGGSGGLACSKEAASYGKKIAVLDFVEPSPQGTRWGLGGTCVNVGCIPKKLMHQASLLGEALHDARKYGWQVPTSIAHSWETLIEGVQNYIKSLNWGHRSALNTNKVDYINARGVFVDDHTINTITKDGKEKTLTSKNFVIAVGGRPTFPNDVPGAMEYGISSDDIFNLKKPPGKTLIVGASYVALECAGFLTGLGFDTYVMVRSTCLRGFDQQMAGLIRDNMKSKGTKFLNHCTPVKVEKRDGRLEVTWRDKQNITASDSFDTVLFAIGRHAKTRKLNLDQIGVKLDETTGTVFTVNEQTNIPHIYAIGDVLHEKPQLTPVAIQAGRLLAHRIFGNSKNMMEYEKVATTIFTPLEYGCVGISEETAFQRFGDDNIEIYHAFYKPLEYTVAEKDASQCYFKVVSMRQKPQKVVGIHFLGPNAGEVIQGFSVALKCNVSVQQVLNTVGIHPTTAEELVKFNITKRSGKDPVVTGC